MTTHHENRDHTVTDDRDHTVTDDQSRGERLVHGRHREAERDEAAAHDKFGGANLGAAFFGWLVAIGMTILLSGIVGAVAAAVGTSADVTQTAAEREAGTIGVVAAAILVAIMLIAYYTGGYVAGRMSRFDGGKQGLAVWVIGLLVTALAVGTGLLFGSQYNILDRVDLPRMPLPTEQLSYGGIITAVVVVIGTLLAAMLGGTVGRRYHHRVDKAYYR